MGNEVSKVVDTASHVQKVVNSVVNLGVANIVGTVAGKKAGAATRAIGRTVSTVTSVDGAAQAAAVAARNTAFLLKKTKRCHTKTDAAFSIRCATDAAYRHTKAYRLG